MDEELVSGSVVQEGGSQGQSEDGSAAPQTYTEVFLLHLPFYLSIGMTAEEFWHGDVWLAKAYRKAYEMKQKRENERLWLQGMYFYDALCAASPLLRAAFGKGQIKPLPYEKEPYPLTEKEFEERKRRDEIRHKQEIQARIRADMMARKQAFKNKEVTEDAKRND